MTRPARARGNAWRNCAGDLRRTFRLSLATMNWERSASLACAVECVWPVGSRAQQDLGLPQRCMAFVELAGTSDGNYFVARGPAGFCSGCARRRAAGMARLRGKASGGDPADVRQSATGPARPAFCHDPTALPFSGTMKRCAARLGKLSKPSSATCIRISCSGRAVCWPACQGLVSWAHSKADEHRASNGRYWRPFHVRLCPALAGDRNF